MFNRIIAWFYNKNKNHTKKNKLKSEKKFVEMESFNKTGEILIHQKTTNKIEFNEVLNYTINNNLSNKELINVIGINISFLEKLSIKIENTIYINEYEKINEMIEQSKKCKKIIETISSSQIFYKNTIEIIKKHTITIGKLVKYINKLENDGKI